MALILHLLAALVLVPYTISAQNTWLYPDPTTNPTYNNIDILNASWTTNYDSPTLLLWCTANAGGAYGQKYNQSVPPIGNRLLQLNFSETAPQGCHFNIAGKKDQAKSNLNSGNFNIQIETSTKTITWSPTNPTSSAASSSTTQSAASKTFSPVASSSAPAQHHKHRSSGSGLSPAAKAGLAIGAVAGTIALIAGVLYWLRNRRRWRRSQLAKFDASLQKPPAYHASELTALDSHTAPVETDGRMLDHEMFGNPIAKSNFIGELEANGAAGEPVGTAR